MSLVRAIRLSGVAMLLKISVDRYGIVGSVPYVQHHVVAKGVGVAAFDTESYITRAVPNDSCNCEVTPFQNKHLCLFAVAFKMRIHSGGVGDRSMCIVGLYGVKHSVYRGLEGRDLIGFRAP